MFDEYLIDLVRQYPVLYRSKEKNYKSMISKHNCWVKIGAELNKTPEECKSKWRNIRDNYIKHKKKKITGQISFSKYDDEKLNFISESLEDGDISTNVDTSTSDNNIVFEITHSTKEEYDSSEEIPLSESPYILGPTDNVVNTEESTTYSSTIITTTYDSNHSAVTQQNLNLQEQNLNHQEQNPIPPPKRPMKRKIDSIIDELKKDREERNVVLQQLMAKANGSGQSAIHNFFSSMADIVCGFPPEKIAEVRIGICKTVSDMELSILRKKCQSGSRF